MTNAWDERMSAAFETHSRSGTSSSDVKQITHALVTNMANYTSSDSTGVTENYIQVKQMLSQHTDFPEWIVQFKEG